MQVRVAIAHAQQGGDAGIELQREALDAVEAFAARRVAQAQFERVASGRQGPDGGVSRAACYREKEKSVATG